MTPFNRSAGRLRDMRLRRLRPASPPWFGPLRVGMQPPDRFERPSRQGTYRRVRVLARARRMAAGRPGFTAHGARLQPLPQPSQE